MVVAAPQGKLGAAISGQPSHPLAHLESLSSTTINPWWAQELFLLPLMAVAGGGGGGGGKEIQNYTECHRILPKAWIMRLNWHS